MHDFTYAEKARDDSATIAKLIRRTVVQKPTKFIKGWFVEDDKVIALKTIIPSRKATKQYLEKEPDDHEA